MDAVYDEAVRIQRENELIDAEIYRDDLRQERQRVVERLMALDVDLVEADYWVNRKRAAVAQLDFIDEIRLTHGDAVADEVAEHVIGGQR